MVHARRIAIVIEDSPDEARRYGRFLNGLGYAVQTARSYKEAVVRLEEASFDVALIDMHLSRGTEVIEGLDLLEIVQRDHPSTIAIAMSLDPSIKVAEQARQRGALNFIRKPLISADEISIAIQTARYNKTLRDEGERRSPSLHLPPDLHEKCPEGVLITPEHRKMIDAVSSNGKIPVVIYGETGTGKEEIAKLIHRRREQREGHIPMVSVNCANLSGDIVASTLFGHKRGAFSGATTTTNGLIGEANGGILFLDEVHCLANDIQQRLLRVLNDGTYNRVGDTVELRSEFQVIVASTKDLDDAVDSGEFLLDLRMRITGVDFFLPPLRERFNDLSTLIRLYFAKDTEAPQVSPIEIEKLVERCKRYYWRGNIRQLFKVLKNLVVTSLFNDEPIRAENLAEFKSMFAPKGSGTEPLQSSLRQGAHTVLNSPPTQSTLDNEEVTVQLLRRALAEDVALDEVLPDLEKAIISAALKRHRKQVQVYQGLGVSRSSLAQKRQRYGI